MKGGLGISIAPLPTLSRLLYTNCVTRLVIGVQGDVTASATILSISRPNSNTYRFIMYCQHTCTRHRDFDSNQSEWEEQECLGEGSERGSIEDSICINPGTVHQLDALEAPRRGGGISSFKFLLWTL